MQQKILEKLGLTKTEAKIYLLLLSLGTTGATPIIKKAELHRATVYDVLERLIEKGLASYIIKDNIRKYSATEPERFEVILKEKEKEIKEQQDTFEKIKPELKLLQELSTNEFPAEILKGTSGLKTALEDIIKKKKQVYVLGAQGNFQKYIPQYHKIWHKKIQNNKIKCKMIYSEVSRKLRTKHPLPSIEIRYIKDLYSGPTTTLFYNNTVLITMWSDQPIIIRIKNKDLVEHYKTFFKLIWKQANP
jgi:HTH-type transcriptional regulator, sugar sensing transcriptional regulator